MADAWNDAVDILSAAAPNSLTIRSLDLRIEQSTSDLRSTRKRE